MEKWTKGSERKKKGKTGDGKVHLVTRCMVDWPPNVSMCKDLKDETKLVIEKRRQKYYIAQSYRPVDVEYQGKRAIE